MRSRFARSESGLRPHLGRALVIVGLLGVSACVAQVRSHGYVPSESELLSLTPGSDTRETVTSALGSPTAGGVLEDRGFYYVSSEFRSFGPFAPEEISRQVVALDFDTGGILRNIERYGLEDGRVVPLTREVTDDNLRDTTFLRQLLTNIGQFDPTALIGSE